MYIIHFEKQGLKKEKIFPYTRSDLKPFNSTMTPLSFVELMVTFREGRNTLTIDLQFLKGLFKSVYNCILGISFAETLDIMNFPVHLKKKCCDIYDGSIIICFDLSRVQRIYKALHYSQNITSIEKNKKDLLEIHIINLNKGLETISINHQAMKPNSKRKYNVIPTNLVNASTIYRRTKPYKLSQHGARNNVKEENITLEFLHDEWAMNIPTSYSGP